MKTRSRLFMLFISLSSVLVTRGTYAQTVNFSGRWQLDKSKTNFEVPIGNNPAFELPEYVMSRALRITQTSAGLVIDRTNLTAALEEKHYMQQIPFGGKSSQTQTITGNTETDSLTQASGKTSLTIGMSTTTSNGSPVYSVIETWGLTAGGQVLVIDRQVDQPDGTKYEIKGYYTKP